MRIKSKAVLNTSIPESHRLFVEVCGVAVCPPTSVAPLCICVSRHWTVGILLDAICKARGISNPNASTADEDRRLHVFVIDINGSTPQPPTRLPFSSSLDSLGIQDGVSLEVALGVHVPLR
jgi:hypothetical protein